VLESSDEQSLSLSSHSTLDGSCGHTVSLSWDPAHASSFLLAQDLVVRIGLFVSVSGYIANLVSLWHLSWKHFSVDDDSADHEFSLAGRGCLKTTIDYSTRNGSVSVSLPFSHSSETTGEISSIMSSLMSSSPSVMDGMDSAISMSNDQLLLMIGHELVMSSPMVSEKSKTLFARYNFGGKVGSSISIGHYSGQRLVGLTISDLLVNCCLPLGGDDNRSVLLVAILPEDPEQVLLDKVRVGQALKRRLVFRMSSADCGHDGQEDDGN